MRKILKCGAAVLALACLLTPTGVQADNALPETLVPVGETVGIWIRSDGILVVSLSDPEAADPNGLRPGDVILRIGDTPVTNGDALHTAMAQQTEPEVQLTVLRDGEEVTFSHTCQQQEGEYVLGIWARDAMLGLGTVTYYDPAEDEFGALGHRISDADTGTMLPIGEGAIFDAQVTGVVPSQPGTPGQIKAVFVQENPLGVALGNHECGLFGTGGGNLAQSRAAVPVAAEEEIETGPAVILTDVAGGMALEYEVEIAKVYGPMTQDFHAMLITVTDPDLLALTGGIVQGMSGSPILQNGKLIGAVSHVLVNEPCKGYGISVEDMLEAAG